MRIYYTENKQTGQLIFFAFGNFDKKPKTEKWNEPISKIHLKTAIVAIFRAVGMLVTLGGQNHTFLMGSH